MTEHDKQVRYGSRTLVAYDRRVLLQRLIWAIRTFAGEALDE